MKYRFDWGDVWNFILTSSVLSVVVFILICFTSTKKVTEYYLSSECGVSGVYVIEKNISWSFNDRIHLDKNVTLQEAIRAVDSLNKTLK